MYTVVLLPGCKYIGEGALCSTNIQTSMEPPTGTKWCQVYSRYVQYADSIPLNTYGALASCNMELCA